jgi:hypothetical protein
MHARRRGAAVVALAVALTLPDAAPDARAQAVEDAEAQPRGQWGLALAVRRNVGAFGRQYGLGYLAGFVGAFDLTRPDDALALGLAWSTLWGRSQFFGTLGDDDPTIATGALQYFEVSLGLRVRYRLSDELPLVVGVGGGGALLRTHVPVPPNDDRHNLGAYAGGTVEYVVWRNWVLGLDGRYAMFPDAPAGAAFMLSVSWR